MQDRFGRLSRFIPPNYLSIWIFAAAFLPRLSAVGRYVTPDEPIWVFRSIDFREALLAGDWAATIQSGHPGVTVTWLGAISVQLQLWLQPQSQTHLNWLNQLYWLSPDNGSAFQRLATFLTAARLGPIILTSLGLVAIYWLLRSRFSAATAGFGAFLLILDPFTAGLSGLFHLDALLATFMLLAVLILLPKSKSPPTALTRLELLLSGLFTALAILTKTPGLFLIPFLISIILWRTLFHTKTALPFSTKLRRLPAPLLFWAGTILLTLVLLLPALWAAPQTVLETVSGLANRLADSAVRPIFFLGQETLNPGPAFYPLTLAFRLSPVVFIGLALSAVFALPKLSTKRFGTSLNPNLIWLLLFSLGFLFFLNLSAKRFDRYALPAILPLIIISAVGLHAAADKIKKTRLSHIILPAFVLIHISYLLVSLPFPLLAYNWLAGGTAVAQKVFPVGWGEETSQTASRLAAEPGSANRTLYTSNIPAAAAFYPGQLLPIETQTLTRLQPEDFVHFVPQDWQLFNNPSDQDFSLLTFAIQNFIRSRTITDFDKAQLFTNLNPSDFTLPAFESLSQDIYFEDKIAVTSAGALTASWPSDIQIGVEWQPLQSIDANYFYRLELVDQNGEVWLSQENPLLNAVGQPVRYWPPDEGQEVFYSLSPPSDLAPVDYTIQLSLFDEEGARLGIFREDGRFAGVTTDLASISIPAPVAQLPPQPPNPINLDLELIGFDMLPTTAETGLPIKLDLWWRHTEQTPQSTNLRLLIGDETADYPITTNGWLPGQVYHLRPVWQVPTELDSAPYPLRLQLFDDNGRPLWPTPIELGQIEIISRSRAFDLPTNLDPLQIQLGTVAKLQETAVELTDEAILITVTWQALNPDGIFYTTFVHLIDESGSTISQGDRPPLEPTNSWVSGQVVQEQYQLNRPANGRYTIAIGLYNQTNGLRPPMFAADGTQLPDDQYLIEITIP